MSALFRRKAIEAQQQKLTGDIILTQPTSLAVIIWFIVLSTAVIVILVCSFEYTRKETVQGILQPDTGIIKMYAGKRGVLTDMLVSEGDIVHEGQAIARIVHHTPDIQGKSLIAEKIRYLEEQISLITENIQQSHTQEEVELKRLQLLHAKLTNSHESSSRVIAILQEKFRLIEKRQQRMVQLAERGHISNAVMQDNQQQLLQLKQELELSLSKLKTTNSEIALVQHQKAQVSSEFDVKRRELMAQQVTLNAQLIEVKSNIDYMIKAHQSGTVTAIHRRPGSTIEATHPILTIVPEGAKLIAEILLPTRSAGFLRSGKHAKLRFDAFPHQRFGFVNSTITDIEKTVITQRENDLPIAINEPMYRIRAVLEQQAIIAYGEEFPLRSGMHFLADIHLDSRSLLDWILDPIYSLRGKIT